VSAAESLCEPEDDACDSAREIVLTARWQVSSMLTLQRPDKGSAIGCSDQEHTDIMFANGC
jgi:hypothetical protein